MGIRSEATSLIGHTASGAVGFVRGLPIINRLPLIGVERGLEAAEVDGYFPADSMIRRLHRERLVAFSGIRALLMQACDPVAVVGFQKHSVIFTDPQSRLQSTDERMSRMYFGTVEQAEKTGEEIRKMHSRVKGETVSDYGPIPAGTPYAADDPVLGLWVLSTLADSALIYYEELVGSLTPEERQAYWDDYRKIGSLLGMPDGSMPRTEPEMRDYIATRCRDGSLWISGEVRDLSVGVVFDPPFEGWVRIALTPVGEVVKLTSIGLLPDEIRRMYGFSWDGPREALLRSTVLQLKASAKLWPDVLRLHPAARKEPGVLYSTEAGEDWRTRDDKQVVDPLTPSLANEQDDLGVPSEGEPAPSETRGTAPEGNGSGALSRLEQALTSGDGDQEENPD